MSATFSTLRIGEVVQARAIPTASDGSPGLVTPEDPAWTLGSSGVVSIVPDGVDPYLVEITALAPGVENLYFLVNNVFADEVAGHEVLTVINASALGFSIPNPFTLKDISGSSAARPEVQVTAFGIDVRDDNDRLPAYSISNLSWLRSNNNVWFDIGSGPTDTNPVTGIQSLKIIGIDDGQCTVTVTADNSESEPITGQLLVTVVGTLVVSLELVQS